MTDCKPTPTVDNDSRFFWESCKEHKLVIRHCDDCDSNIFYPRSICPNCTSDNLSWLESEGKGEIYTYTVARRPAGPAFKEDVPYVIAMVDLNEGVRMMTNIINVNEEDVYIGMPVKVNFQTVDEFTYPKFEPIRD